MFAAAAHGELEVIVAAAYPLAKATDALDAFRTGPLGKVVVTI